MKKSVGDPNPLPPGVFFLFVFKYKVLRIALNGAKIDQKKIPLVSMGGWAEGQACADPGARTTIGAIINFSLLISFSISLAFTIPLYLECLCHKTCLRKDIKCTSIVCANHTQLVDKQSIKTLLNRLNLSYLINKWKGVDLWMHF